MGGFATLLILFLLLRSGSDSREAPSTIEVKREIPSKSYLFVPYWSLSNNKKIQDKSDVYIYFGIMADRDGVVRNEQGYESIDKFRELSDLNKEELLVVRMLDSEINSNIIRNHTLQEKIIDETIGLAGKYDFDGVLLDFEMNAIPFEKVVLRINEFYKLFFRKVKEENLSFYVTIFGDTYYRVRPYNIKVLGDNSDGILIMAYDFHKARGNPGPNFPLRGRERYGYDFEKMVEDFSKDVSSDKISVIFGVFGYDWVVNEKGDSVGVGEALSLNKIKQDFLSSCGFKACIVRRDRESSESVITFEDADFKKHRVWFEDMESIARKKEVLKKAGIRSYGFWAYSYY